MAKKVPSRLEERDLLPRHLDTLRLARSEIGSARDLDELRHANLLLRSKLDHYPARHGAKSLVLQVAHSNHPNAVRSTEWPTSPGAAARGQRPDRARAASCGHLPAHLSPFVLLRQPELGDQLPYHQGCALLSRERRARFPYVRSRGALPAVVRESAESIRGHVSCSMGSWERSHRVPATTRRRPVR